MFLPETTWPNPPYKPAPKRTGNHPVVNVSLMKSIGLKVHKSAVVRKKIAGRLKLAVRLIVTRGAQAVSDKNGKLVLVLDEEDAGRKWILDGACIVPTCRNDY